MKANEVTDASRCTRREFLRGTVAAVSLPLCATAIGKETGGGSQGASEGKLAFVERGKEYHFETTALRGVLRSGGRSHGLTPVLDSASGGEVAGRHGLFSHYRLLDDRARYGPAAWDWPSVSRLLPDGSVTVAWSSDKEHPFDMQAAYRLSAPGVLNVTTTVTPREDLKAFEVFLASYFKGFASSFVYVKGCDATGGKPGFLEATRSRGVWQAFPRDAAAAKMVRDGRWKRPPSPVRWEILPPLAGPLGMRRDEATGLAGLVMAPPQDCFSVSTPFGEEGHRSLYLSLFGRDLKAGQSARARSRLVIARGISDEGAIALYRAYLKEIERGSVGRTP